MKRKIEILLLLIGVLASLSCRNGRRDAAYYEQMVDSIRKAEQVKEMQKQAAEGQSPSVSFFDTLRIHTLPIRSTGNEEISAISFSPVPDFVNELFGYAVDSHLHAVSLPPVHHHQVILLADQEPVDISSLHLFVMDKHHQPIDILCIYSPKSVSPKDDNGETYMEYFITSSYEITLIQYFKAFGTQKSQVVEARRYIINEDGHFEETLIEID
jgi:hypothetical protein